jgi:hypothetical protein
MFDTLLHPLTLGFIRESLAAVPVDHAHQYDGGQ